MRTCDRCGKGVLVGMNVSHSHVRTKKRSWPNLHNFTTKIGGIKRRLHLCTKCLRVIKAIQAIEPSLSRQATAEITRKEVEVSTKNGEALVVQKETDQPKAPVVLKAKKAAVRESKAKTEPQEAKEAETLSEAIEKELTKV